MDASDAPIGDPGAGLARGWLEHSPYVAHLGIRLDEIAPGTARLSMPFADVLPTMGDTIHGGAISSLIDTAAATAAWAGAEVPEHPRASTISLTVNFLSPARSQGVAATARVVRRGSVSVIEVDVTADDGTEVATALVTYRL